MYKLIDLLWSLTIMWKSVKKRYYFCAFSFVGKNVHYAHPILTTLKRCCLGPHLSPIFGNTLLLLWALRTATDCILLHDFESDSVKWKIIWRKSSMKFFLNLFQLISDEDSLIQERSANLLKYLRQLLDANRQIWRNSSKVNSFSSFWFFIYWENFLFFSF
jgi:hypothetical protein